MDNFHSYFHPENIIKLLCKYRMKYAMKKHKLHLLADISNSQKAISDVKELARVPVELSKLLPSRRTWYKPNIAERKKFKDSQRLQQFALFKTIKTIHIKAKDNEYSPPIWYNELTSFIKELQERANNPHKQEIKKPKSFPIKKENTKQCKECRPLALYELSDRIVISLTAKYFTDLFDDYFSKSSYAFRAVKVIGNSKFAITHHDTIGRILDYKARNAAKIIYVAECDIKKFFDCVDHELVKEKLQEFITTHSLKLAPNAEELFLQYLKSYSFSRDVYPLKDTDHFKDYRIDGGFYKWICKELEDDFYGSSDGFELNHLDIGVPQGGALSCFISNLFLHSVDEQVNIYEDEDLLYLRFCDDMVILHTDKNKCELALVRYQTAIKSLRLKIHDPVIISNYSRKFWSTKSKAPYQWSAKSAENANVPWLSFVGYQVKYDSAIRVRKKSFNKEMKKQLEECDKVLKSLDHLRADTNVNVTSKKSRKQQLFALENRLISMSVGRIKLYEKNIDQSLCWTNGFKALNANSTSLKQLKLLDGSRTKQLYRIKKKLETLVKPSENPEIDSGKFHFGSPYSYHNFLILKQNVNYLTKEDQPDN